MRSFAIPCSLAALLCCLGCSKSGPERASVSGNILLDGQPLARGSINFIPVEAAAGPTAGATIESGKYRIDCAKGVVVGENQVRISSVQPTGRKVASAGELTDEWAELLPAEYHSKTTLIRTVQSAANVLNFDLKGKAPGR